MEEDLVQRLEDYRTQNNLTYTQLAQQLEVPENYLYRWRRKNSINGIYAKFVTLFLEQREVTIG